MLFRNIIISAVILLLSSISASAARVGEGDYVPEIGKGVRPAVQVLEKEQRDGYECRMIEFSVEAQERVKAYLLVPDGASRRNRKPAIVMLHDHGARFDIGKEKLVRPMGAMLPLGEEDHIARSSRQWVDKNFDGVWLADSLASLGYVVLVTDALYWGDRSSAQAQRWSELTYGATPDRKMAKTLKTQVYEGQRDVFADLQSKGVIWAEKMLRDDVASVKLLAALPYVDSARIGAFGFSMGAHRCWLLSAFCNEVRCGAALSWMTTLEGYEGNNASDLSMRIQPMRECMDFGDIGRYLAPKPMLFLNGETDHLFPKDKVQKAFDLLRLYYNEAGSDALVTEFFPGGHHCGKDVQALIVSFFNDELFDKE